MYIVNRLSKAKATGNILLDLMYKINLYGLSVLFQFLVIAIDHLMNGSTANNLGKKSYQRLSWTW